MSTVYALVPTILPASITLPQDLVDQRSAASVNDPITAVANGVAYLNQVATTRRNIGAPIGVSSATWARTVQPQAYGANTGGQRIGADTFQNVNVGANEGKHLYWDLTPYLINGCTLVNATVYLSAVGTAHGALPAYMPAVTALIWDSAAPLAYDLNTAGFTVDASASVAAYEARHTVVATFDQYNTINLGYTTGVTYWLAIVNEGGANAKAGLTVEAVVIEMTAPRYQT